MSNNMNDPTSRREDDDIPFREMNRKQKITTVIIITALLTMAAGILFGIYFFGMAGLFNIFGVQYDSLLSLAIFVISVFFLGIIADFCFLVIYVILIPKINNNSTLLILSILVETFKNWLVLFTVDEFMGSISLALHTEWILAFILALIEIAFNDEKLDNWKRKDVA